MDIVDIFKEEEVLQERTKLVFSRRGSRITKKYRCINGKQVSSPRSCPSRKNLLKKKKLSSRKFRYFNSKPDYFDRLKRKRSVRSMLGNI